jgi:putative ABC transport system permease protein
MIKNTPPKFATRLLRWFCHDDFYEELQGDLEEAFYQNIQSIGIKKARARYRSEVLKLIRPSVIKKVKFLNYQNNTAMFQNYTLVAIRSMMRNKLFSAINIFGLSVSMAVGLLAITFLNEMNSYDQFHENADRIYRITNTRTNIDDTKPEAYATTSILTGRRLAEDFAGFEKIVPIYNGFSGDIKQSETTFQIKGLYAGEDFLNVFTFPLLSGNPSTALVDPFSMIVSEELAQKIFSKTDVIGEVLEKGKKQYKVTAVIKNVPENSHMKFDAVASLSSLESDEDRKYILDDWGTMWSSYVYVLLPKAFDQNQIQSNLDRLAKEENAKVERFEIGLHLEAMTDIFPGDGKYNQISTVVPKKSLNQIIILTLIVLFSACFNYANLTIARSIKRAKEVGVRKVVGAQKFQIFSQFIIEAIFISFLALVFAFIIFNLIKPEFISLNYYISRTTSLKLTTTIYLYFLGFTILIGTLAGTIPSLIMSKFKTLAILKGGAAISSGKGFGLRKIMIGLQFALSMGFAIMVTLAYKQYRFAVNFDLGYDKENVLNIDSQNNDIGVMKAALASVPGVKQIAASSMVPSTGSLNSSYAKEAGGVDSVVVYGINVDEAYIPLMNHQFIVGDNFNTSLENRQIIVNETLIKKLGYSPEEALGKKLEYYTAPSTIMGVIKDFHYGTIYNAIEPFAFVYDKDRKFYNLAIKVESTDMLTTLDKLEAAWSTVDNIHEFDASFFDESIKSTYKDLSSSMKTYGFLAAVAISISVLGLMGMAVYTAESRLKEITIRKVLGASLSSLVTLLSRSFFIVFILAAAVAIPASYYLFTTTISRNMEYKIEIGFWELGSGAILIILISLITIGSQTIKAAKSNPADSLRNE